MKGLFYKTKFRYFWISILVFFIDFVSKLCITKNLFFGEIVPLLPFLNIYLIFNYGGVFGIFADSLKWSRWIFSSISIGICTIIFFIMLFSSKKINKWRNIAYSLILGGAIGNLFDRISYGFVIDMIDFHIKSWHFATFNIADVSIFIGATIFFLGEFLEKKF